MNQESKRAQLECNPGDICSLHLGAGSVCDEKTDERVYGLDVGLRKWEMAGMPHVSGLSSLVDELLAP